MLETMFDLAQRVYDNSIPEPNSGCVIYLGFLDRDGYGKITPKRKSTLKRFPRMAHRVTYEAERGPIPEGLTLDHQCKVACCCNPYHTEPATFGDNAMRGNGPAAKNARKTRCKRGHPLSGVNLFINVNGARICKECRNIYQRQRLGLKNPRVTYACSAD